MFLSHIDVSLTLSPSLPFSLKINKIFKKTPNPPSSFPMQDLNTPSSTGCPHSDPHLSQSHPTHHKENEAGPKRGSPYSLTLKGSELLSSPEEEKRRGRVFDAEVQTENPENNQRGSGGDRRITGPPSIPLSPKHPTSTLQQQVPENTAKNH